MTTSRAVAPARNAETISAKDNAATSGMSAGVLPRPWARRSLRRIRASGGATVTKASAAESSADGRLRAGAGETPMIERPLARAFATSSFPCVGWWPLRLVPSRVTNVTRLSSRSSVRDSGATQSAPGA